MIKLVDIVYENIYLLIYNALERFEVLNVGAFTMNSIISTGITIIILFLIIGLPIYLIYKGFSMLLGGLS